MPTAPEVVIRHSVGRMVASAGLPDDDAEGLIVSLRNELRPVGRAPGPFTAVAFNSTGDELVTLDEHGQLVCFYLQHNRFAAIRRAGTRAVSIEFSPLRRTELYVALADGTIECVDTATKAVVGSLKGHVHAARTLTCHPSQPYLLSCAGDAAMLWSTNDFSRLRTMPAAETRSLQHACFLPSGGGLLTCVESRLTLWRLGSLEAVGTLRLPPTQSTLRLRAATTSADSAFAFGAGEGGWLAVWSLASCALAKMILLPEACGPITQLAPLAALPAIDAHPGGVLLACADGALRVLDAAAPAVRAQLVHSRDRDDN